MLTIKEVSKLCGVTTRTLHYYDEIGIFKPSLINNSGYRLYSEDSLIKLQEILFFKELDFSLKEIKNIISDPNYDRKYALNMQKEILIKKKNRIEDLIKLINKSMDDSFILGLEKFKEEDIEKMKDDYKKEVKERWGNTLEYKEFKEKGYSNNDNERFKEEIEGIFRRFKDAVEFGEDSKEAQELVKVWHDYINNNFYTCSKEVLSNLGDMYVYDERFKNNIDKDYEGLSEFINKAIKVYCSK
ncbi:MerR family transcriptional regulator [Clostridium chrysemydis]|uniref:MerR family transcriptional regulator n=1 Tax=Clostridium chrysemydis TaxID=2665504 RepID=UPI001883F66B|nr:MerR family transcriptional regulator [Clostridium chrysemydis]